MLLYPGYLNFDDIPKDLLQWGGNCNTNEIRGLFEQDRSLPDILSRRQRNARLRSRLDHSQLSD